MRASVERSIGIVTALNPYIGYANATAVAQEAHRSGRTVHDVVLEKGLLSKDTLDAILRPEVLTRPQPITAPVDSPMPVAGRGTRDLDTDVPTRRPPTSADHAGKALEGEANP